MKRFPHFAWIARVACLLGCFLACAGRAEAVSKEPGEYQVKAAYLYQFTLFIEWPAAAFPQSDTPIIIGLIGDDPFGIILDETVRDVTANNRKFRLRRLKQGEDLTQCHILFVGRSEKGRVPQILAEVQNKSILTVSETEGFAQAGGIINFVLVGGRVKFQINLPAADSAGLKVSAKLLEVAKVIKRTDRKTR